jgi:segregation and condensation protein A
VEDPFETTARVDETSLVVDLDVYEGPLDVLLTLAREQKVDLRSISILKLAEQYLAFVAAAKKISLEIAAEYLVMAAWLAYLKSRLLLPQEEAGEPSAEDLAERLAAQLRRLDAMREAARALQARDQLADRFFARGMPEGVRVIRRSVFTGTLYDLARAYGDILNSRGSAEILPLKLHRRRIMSVEDAILRLEKLLGRMPEWSVLQSFLPRELASPDALRSAMAATFGASLELTRRGQIELRQMRAFGPLYIRRTTTSEPTP